MSEPAKPGGSHPRRAGVHKGDELFYRHPRKGAVSGKVLAHGEHGCTLQCGKQRHKVKWDNVLGHKARSPQDYCVAEEGEDGLVVADAKGRRRYVSTVEEGKGNP